jgi:hypothetical protein
MPLEATRFLVDFVHRFHILGFPSTDVMLHLLSENQKLGAHSSIVVIDLKGAITEYRWSHCSRRPFGIPLPFQCPDCKCFNSYKKVYTIPDTAVWRCTSKSAAGIVCGAQQVFTNRPTAVVLDIQNRGDWLTRHLPPDASVETFLN